MKTLIGIDPDCKKNGVAIIRKCQNVRTTVLKSMSFFELFNYLTLDISIYPKDNELKVYISAGWLNKKVNFRTKYNKGISERISERIGANHETGRKIVEMCEFLNIEYELVKPTTSKIVNAKYFSQLTGIIGKTNQDQRDAMILIIGRI